MGSRPVPAHQRHQGCLEHEAATRPRHHPEIRLAPGAPHPHGLERPAAAVRGAGRGGRGLHWRQGAQRHESKKLKAGRGPVGKQPVAGAHDRASGQLAAAPLAGTAKPDLHGFVGACASAEAAVYTDEASAYAGVPAASHETVNHSAGEYVRGPVHTNSIESFWALFKRGYYGTYHHMSGQHLRRYLDELPGGTTAGARTRRSRCDAWSGAWSAVG